eukprot:m.75021 g.75021  ORF g.75021 m.75021 type:complete len:90 (+) comp35926_c0_seq4:144-413(+)
MVRSLKVEGLEADYVRYVPWLAELSWHNRAIQLNKTKFDYTTRQSTLLDSKNPVRGWPRPRWHREFRSCMTALSTRGLQPATCPQPTSI